MTLDFTVTEEAYQHALTNVFKGSANPENAAHGRAAEPVILEYANKLYSPYRVVSYEEGFSLLPPEHQASCLKDKLRYDGLVFNGLDFIGVVDAKLAIQNSFSISDYEWPAVNYCRENGLSYYIALAKCQSRATREYTYLGLIDIEAFLLGPDKNQLDVYPGYRRFPNYLMSPYFVPQS